MTDQSRATLLTRAKLWPEVEGFYCSLASDERWRVDALLALVRLIRAQEWHTVVFPTTSHETLCLARHATFVWGEDMLQVTPAGTACL